MNRKEFIATLGIGGITAAVAYCLGGCKANDQGITAPTNVDFTLDLTNSAYRGLKTAGGYVVNGGVIVANTGNGYVAVSAACTHQGTTIQYVLGSNLFFCPAHGSEFDTNGNVVRGPAASPLAKYKTTLSANGNSLRVYS